MAKTESIISLDPIDRKKKKGILGRLLVTRYHRGKSIVKSEPYGHYMFCGPQGSGKTASYIWYAEWIRNKYRKRHIKYLDHTKCDLTLAISEHTKCKVRPFKEPPKVRLFSNVGIGKHIDKSKIFDTINAFDPDANEIRIVLIDEIHTYFPKDGKNKETQQIRDDLIAIFSQLRKRNTYILSTAQIYGRLDKSLREQCLFMIDCHVNLQNRLVNDFIPEKEILCDELGRWAGDPKYIHVHGLSKLTYDTKRIIRE